VILQAPVSDREYGELDPAHVEHLARARALLTAGRPEALLPRAADPDAPVTAYRYHSFLARGGDDDYFSSDLSDSELARPPVVVVVVPCRPAGRPACPFSLSMQVHVCLFNDLFLLDKVDGELMTARVGEWKESSVTTLYSKDTHRLNVP